MQQIKKTIGFYLSHSYITLAAIVVFLAVIMSMQIILPGNSGSPERITSFMIMTSAVMSSFVGIYFAGGLFKLKQFYLWSINPQYRSVLISSFLILVIIFSIIQIIVMSVNLPANPFLLCVPFCAALYSAYSVLGKTILHKIAIPMSPILLAQTHHLGVPPNMIFMLVILAAFGLLYYLFEVDIDKVKSSKEVLQEVGLGSGSQVPVIVSKLNFLIGKRLSPLISKRKKDLGWALALPYLKVPLLPLTYLLMIIPLAFFGPEAKSVVELFTVVMCCSTVVSIFGESRKHIPQLKFFSHLYGGDNHRNLKSEIIKTVDKIIFQNCFTLVISVIVLCELLSISYNFQVMSIQLALVVLVGLACSPAMLSMRWINVSFTLVCGLIVYFGLIVSAAMWLADTPHSDWLSVYPAIYLLLLFVIRRLSTAYFYQLPFERLLLVK